MMIINDLINFFIVLKNRWGCGERCRELIDAADEMTRRLYNVIDWMFEHPEYNPKTKVIPKKDYPVLVDVTF